MLVAANLIGNSQNQICFEWTESENEQRCFFIDNEIHFNILNAVLSLLDFGSKLIHSNCTIQLGNAMIQIIQYKFNLLFKFSFWWQFSAHAGDATLP